MKIKVYEFRYKNTYNKIFNKIASMLANFVLPIMAGYVILFFASLFGLNKYATMDTYMGIIGICAVIGLFFAIKFVFTSKGVVLYNSYFEITTGTLGYNKPKITINYTDVISVFNGKQDMRLKKRSLRKTFLVGDCKDYIELTLKGGKQYTFSVYNQDDFIAELISRVNKAKEIKD